MKPVKLLTGDWTTVCNSIADDLSKKPVGRSGASESAAVIMFSAREKDGPRTNPSPALQLKNALEEKGLRVFNTSSKTATEADSPISVLLGLLSYLIDPITKQKIPTSKRAVEVWASAHDSNKRIYAVSKPPDFWINNYHANCQKKFFKYGGGNIGNPTSDRKRLSDLIDTIRTNLSNTNVGDIRLTLSGLIARLLADPLFREAGYTMDMFRQALFTQLLEANIAPTRLTMRSLDKPLNVELVDEKFVWEREYWSLLHHFGGYLESEDVEEQEVELFEEDAVIIMTHHASKGLEFDHVIVTGVGREVDFGPVLRTKLFSGQSIPYDLTDKSVTTQDTDTVKLATADREREAYVAMSRAVKTLTILQDKTPSKPYMAANPAVEVLFENSSAEPHGVSENVEVRKWNAN